jgi:hypothetical protein
MKNDLPDHASLLISHYLRDHSRYSSDLYEWAFSPRSKTGVIPCLFVVTVIYADTENYDLKTMPWLIYGDLSNMHLTVINLQPLARTIARDSLATISQ